MVHLRMFMAREASRVFWFRKKKLWMVLRKLQVCRSVVYSEWWQKQKLYHVQLGTLFKIPDKKRNVGEQYYMWMNFMTLVLS